MLEYSTPRGFGVQDSGDRLVPSDDGEYYPAMAERRDPPRIHLTSLGCAKNLVDSEHLLARLGLAGALVGAPPDEADILIVNTCGFIEAAKRESLEVIRRLAAEAKTSPERRVFVMGCLVNRSEAALRAELPEVDRFFRLDDQASIVAACGLGESPEEEARLLLTPPHTAFLRISEGCDNRCTYCTIPTIRGPFRSRAPEAILREAEDLVAGGVQELNLIGQDTTSYGRDLGGIVTVDRLVRELAQIKDLRWIRLLYAHPAHVTDGLIRTFAEVRKLCPYVDLPLQHLDDEILARMGRRVTQQQTLDLIDRLRREIPDLALRTTFIVGFPGETEAQFETLLRLVRELRFDHLGAFAYSREPGTPAADLPGQVSKAEKERRVEELMLVQQEIAFDALRARIGERIEVLIDTVEEDVSIGRTARQAPDVDGITRVPGPPLSPGSFVDAVVVGADGYDAVAEVSR